MKTKITLLDLDVQVLGHLFSFLRLEDQLKLALISDRFDDLMKAAISEQIIDIVDIKLNFTLEEAKQIFSNYGKYIRRYQFVSIFQDDAINDYLQLLPTYCSQLEEIHISDTKMTVDDLQSQLLAKSKNVKTLKLKRCMLGNAMCFLISELAQIETLDLEDARLTGKGFHKLRRISSLNLKNCRNFKTKNFIDICNGNKLKYLNIAGFKQVTSRAVEVLISTQSYLELLTISHDYWSKNFTEICRLESLREISLAGCYEDKAIAFLNVINDAKRKDTLECLEINSPTTFSETGDEVFSGGIVSGMCELQNLKVLSLRNSPLFENSNLVRIARACRQIEMLDLYGSSITDLGVVGCVEYLERLRHLDISYCYVKKGLYSRLVGTRKELGLKEQLIVYIKPNTQLELVLKDAEYAATQHLVKLTLDCMRVNNNIGLLKRLEQLNAKYKPPSLQIKHLEEESDELNLSHEKTISLSLLDDNSLYQIIQYLGVIEKLNLLLISDRFDNIIRQLLRFDMLDIIELMANFTVRETRQVLSRCGTMISRLKLRCPNFHFDIEYIDLISEFCTNLEEIQCIDIIIEQYIKSCNKIFASSSNSLKILKSDYEFDDTAAQEVSNAEHLHTLILKNGLLTGIHLEKLTKLRNLSLNRCRAIDPKHFIAICKSNHLKTLDIQQCSHLDNTCFQVLVETQTELERLALGEVYTAHYIHIISQMKNLKDVSLFDCPSSEAVDILNALSEERADQIEFLELTHPDTLNTTQLVSIRASIMYFRNLLYFRLPSNDSVDNRFVELLCKACPNLEVLDFRENRNLSNAGILFAIKSLKNLRQFDVRFSGFDNMQTLYQEMLKIKRCAKDCMPLVVYIRNGYDWIDDILDTKEYKAMEKYIILSDDSRHNMNKDVYIKKRSRRLGHLKTKPQSKIVNIDFTTQMQPTSSILDFPDNCIMQIALHLPTINKLKFAYAHDRFMRVLKPHLSELIWNINDISRAFTLVEIERLLSKCGQELRRLRFVVSRESCPIEYLKRIFPFKEHLREIHLENITSYQAEIVAKLFACQSQKLEKLTIKDSYDTEPIFTSMLQREENHPPDLTSLTELHLSHCEALNTAYFIEICRRSQLRCLDIRGCHLLENEAFEVLIETQNQYLQWIGIGCDYVADNFRNVALLKNLKDVSIEFCSKLLEFLAFLDMLVEHRHNDLCSLEINSIMVPNCNYCLYRIVQKRCKKFQKIKKVNIDQHLPYWKPYIYE